MALGSARVSDRNNFQGDFKQTERQFLFIGHAGKNSGQILYIDQSSDLDDLLGTNSSKMKTAITAAMNNGGQGWTCIAMPQSASGNWRLGFDHAMNEDQVCEAVVITDALDIDPLDYDPAKAELAAMQAAAEQALAEYGRRVVFLTATRPFDPAADAWDEFITDITPAQAGVSAYRVGLLAEIYPGFLGTICGRLCRSDVSLGDSPMRTATGALIGVGSLPADKNGLRYNKSHAKALNDARFTVPVSHSDFAGIYCSDCQLLDVEGGDFQVIEYLRPLDAAARRIRVLALSKIADRSLNSSDASTAAHSAYFMRPITELSRSQTIGNTTIPGALLPPKPGDISITWSNKTDVDIAIQATPYDSPKAIGISIGLNLN